MQRPRLSVLFVIALILGTPPAHAIGQSADSGCEFVLRHLLESRQTAGRAGRPVGEIDMRQAHDGIDRALGLHPWSPAAPPPPTDALKRYTLRLQALRSLLPAIPNDQRLRDNVRIAEQNLTFLLLEIGLRSEGRTLTSATVINDIFAACGNVCEFQDSAALGDKVRTLWEMTPDEKFLGEPPAAAALPHSLRAEAAQNRAGDAQLLPQLAKMINVEMARPKPSADRVNKGFAYMTFYTERILQSTADQSLTLAEETALLEVVGRISSDDRYLFPHAIDLIKLLASRPIPQIGKPNSFTLLVTSINLSIAPQDPWAYGILRAAYNTQNADFEAALMAGYPLPAESVELMRRVHTLLNVMNQKHGFGEPVARGSYFDGLPPTRD